MVRKKSRKSSSEKFDESVDSILEYLDSLSRETTDEHQSWSHDLAIIRLYRAFETFMLELLIGAINNDSSFFSKKSGIKFPVHMSEAVCEYLVTQGNFFDFKGRDNLLRKIKKYLSDQHELYPIIKKNKYKNSLDQLSALRNYAAHGSRQAKQTALKAVGHTNRMPSAGAWLKSQGRFQKITAKLKELSREIHDAAPY